MIRIAITIRALEAIEATLPLGAVCYEPEVSSKGERLIWIEEIWCNKLDAMRNPGESYGDVIEALELP